MGGSMTLSHVKRQLRALIDELSFDHFRIHGWDINVTFIMPDDVSRYLRDNQDRSVAYIQSILPKHLTVYTTPVAIYIGLKEGNIIYNDRLDLLSIASTTANIIDENDVIIGEL